MSIEIINLNYIYNDASPVKTIALEDINLKINSGEFIGIIGHTGSGKSTLIQHLNGLEKATSGDILFHGVSIYSAKYDMKALRTKVGLVFQYPEHQLFEESVFIDVCFGPKNLGITGEELEKRAKEALDMVGLDVSYHKQSPFMLSGGQKRRVAIAGILAMKPEVLILDEPTAGLDPKGRDEILGILSKLHKEYGITIILVSHSMDDVADYVERIIVMNKGKKVYDDTPKEVFKNYKDLEKMGLAAPQITYIISALNKSGFELDSNITTTNEAKAAILKQLNKK